MLFRSSMFLRVFIAQKQTNIHAFTFFKVILIPCILCALSSFICSHFIAGLLSNEWIKVISSTGVNFVFIVVSSYLFCLTKQEKKILKDLFHNTKLKFLKQRNN